MEEKIINHHLKEIKNYQGSYNLKHEKDLNIRLLPSLICLNISSKKNNFYWIGISITEKKVIICDPLNKIKFNKNLSKRLINFLFALSFNREIIFIPKLTNSKFYFYYIIHFIKFFSKLNSCQSYLKNFSSDFLKNDDYVKQIYNLI